jgi:hypothetical protein
MVDKKSSAFTNIIPLLTDKFVMVDDPGGVPDNAIATGTEVLAMFQAALDQIYYGYTNVKFTDANFIKFSDTALADVPDLTFTTESGGVYRFKANLFLSTGGTSGAKVSMSGTNTATEIRYFISFRTATAFAGEMNTALDGEYGLNAAYLLCEITGYIQVNEGGTLTVKFAQNASIAANSTVLVGSWLEVEKIG